MRPTVLSALIVIAASFAFSRPLDSPRVPIVPNQVDTGTVVPSSNVVGGEVTPSTETMPTKGPEKRKRNFKDLSIDTRYANVRMKELLSQQGYVSQSLLS